MLFMLRRWLLDHITKKQAEAYRPQRQPSSNPARLPYSGQNTTQHAPFPALT